VKRAARDGRQDAARGVRYDRAEAERLAGGQGKIWRESGVLQR